MAHLTWPPEAAALLRRCSFPPPGQFVVCAVSGGADSLAMLALAYVRTHTKGTRIKGWMKGRAELLPWVHRAPVRT